VIIGEGGSGGAIALAVANTVLMLEHAIYSVISPEGCASILWRDGDKARDAAEALRITSHDLLELSVIDDIIDEPLGGAHRDVEDTTRRVGDAVAEAFDALRDLNGDSLQARRREKFLEMGRPGLA
jgi:acetyl-CoA carboxylase carboxyl transferase subunit alpha